MNIVYRPDHHNKQKCPKITAQRWALQVGRKINSANGRCTKRNVPCTLTADSELLTSAS
ncbi:hypothetical protein CPB83DRAFT_863145 [Crepidotus variabilis]|uniref:Uncharacterized protein n=1 Tax=Crepidotus variabilis TaxID=179855 RepID=A0A9P6E6A0_9AGAR|nr:hypothetical protein CPB83DRAFT_863145 [Crepidotus variabilis]